ncbi:hypothetical protein HRbin27_02063 [bacterium HR27]|nr:hypothetical protein HRbin27_02063 [bacterium HR27]
MTEHRHLPAESTIELGMERRRRDPLFRPQDVRDLHGVIVDDVRQMVGREAVRLEQDEVLQQPVLVGDLAAQEVDDRRLPLERHLEADDRWLAACQARFHLLRRQGAAVPVVAGWFAARPLLLAHPLEPLRRAEAVVGVAVLDQPAGMLLVERQALALDVRPVGPTDIRPLVPLQTEPLQPLDDPFDALSDQPGLVRVLDAQDEGTAVLPREEPVEERRPRPTHVQVTGRARCEADTHTLFGHRSHPRFPERPRRTGSKYATLIRDERERVREQYRQ